MAITYQSTRSKAENLSLEQVVLAGLAPDGGLYIPSHLPRFNSQQIHAMRKLDYPALAAEILWPFFEGSSISKETLHHLLVDSYSEFRHTSIAPLKQLGKDQWLLELFHGPTLAFKDFALQFLGRLLETLLAKKSEHVTVLGATSGDTGSAAIAGCRARGAMDIVILHPHNRISEVQRRQMTTIADANVHNIALEGSFDDCQNIVKALFTDAEFRKSQRLTAVNSINWARIMAQIVYYFYAALRLGSPAQAISFSVPTGNFGDIYAGYLAKKMGLPIQTLLIATNHNDILTRCVETGEYRANAVQPSLSPSMDIQISSNFERLLYGYANNDSHIINELMQQLKEKGGFALPTAMHQKLKADFAAIRIDDKQTSDAIAKFYANTGEILDPHSAIGVAAAYQHGTNGAAMVTLATAHPAKFPDAVKAAISQHPPLPIHMENLYDLTEKMAVLPADSAAIKDYIQKHCAS